MTKKKATKKTSAKKTAAKKKPRQKKTCGDHGGQKPDGKPCTRLAGWGTKKKTGPCKDHGDAAHVKMQRIKKEFLELYGEGTISKHVAAKRVGVDQATIWRWRQDDPEFDKQLESIQQAVDEIRRDIAEEAYFKKVLDGKTHGVETIYWFNNRGMGRWKDRKELSGPDGGPIKIHEERKLDLSGLPDEDLADLIRIARNAGGGS